MNILHVGWAFQPYRRGGLIEYAEDLMEIQVKNGYNVFYFCTGRFNLFLKKPTIKRWKNKRGYQVFELVNPPIISGLDNGISQPLADVAEQETEIAFNMVLDEVRPDIVHFQEFIGIPTSILNQLKNQNIKSVYTAEDYFPLCPTLKLVKSDGQLCTLKEPELGEQCFNCCRCAPTANLNYRIQSMFGLFDNKIWPKVAFFAALAKRLVKPKMAANNQIDFINTKASEFNTRRKINIENLYQCDLILAMSKKVATIYSFYGTFNNLNVLNLTLNHIGDIQPRKIRIAEKEKITFGLINAMGTRLKGRELMLRVFEMVQQSTLKDKLQFVILGDLADETEISIEKFPFVEYKGRYKPENLNSILELLNVHIGILPSVWEEAYGYVGIEFLAKGIPLIGNQIGGITDYLKDEETGWLNYSCTADELFKLIENIVNRPESIEKINQNLIANRSKYVKNLQDHFLEMNQLYEQLIY